MKPEYIRAMRVRCELSQQEFATALGVTTVSISRWELGKAEPSKLALQKLRAFDFEHKEKNDNER
tara:strand:- start:116 stop:310 length:195 start_codon:yes stop_codon:yes gene_type:complete